MLRSMALTVAIAGAAGIAQAQGVPATAEDCLKSAFELAKSAESRKLTDEELDRIEEMLTRMESHCGANKLSDAARIAKDIKAALDAK